MRLKGLLLSIVVNTQLLRLVGGADQRSGNWGSSGEGELDGL